MISHSRFLLFFILAVSACSRSVAPPNDALTERFDKMRANLMGKQVTSLASLIDDGAFHRGRASLVLLFSGFDCSSCLAKGFDFVMDFEDRYPGSAVFVVGTSTNTGSAQLQFGYEQYIYSDVADAVRRELKFIQTPVILLLDGDYLIQALHFPLMGEDRRERAAFEGYVRQSMALQ